MHTHSEYSHDSVCSIENMCLSQIEKGTKIFAVTDHCDIIWCNDKDVITPIKNAYDNVRQLNEKYDGKCKILAGVEICETFWYPQVYQQAHDLVPYDVIIGSVHTTKYDKYDAPYSLMDLSPFSEKQLYEFLDCYFDDVLKMIEFADFDILAHLTCPIRYIVGKYKFNIDISKFEEKILAILKAIIEKNIALEINTSAFNTLNDFMPSKTIIKEYYDMGGRLITLGSDAHIAENASNHFDKAITIIKEIGFENICYFQNRKINKIKI